MTRKNHLTAAMSRWPIDDAETLATESTEALRGHALALGAGLRRIRAALFSDAMRAGRAAHRETTPSQSLLATAILPFYQDSDSHHRLLFVGCDQHTAGYERLFAKKTVRTLDADADRALLGAARPQVAPTRNMVFLLPQESIDVIVCNGRRALGESREDMEAACEAALRTLRPGGHLVIVLSEDVSAKSLGLDDIAELKNFEPLDVPPLKTAEPAVARTARRLCRFYQKPSDRD